jgi:hypothetical protein
MVCGRLVVECTLRLHIPQEPPSLAQCLQYRQLEQALHGSAPVQVASEEFWATRMLTTPASTIAVHIFARFRIETSYE